MKSEFTTSELVTLYVDGESTQLEEQQLFNELIIQRDIQQELKNAIQVKSLLVPELDDVPFHIEKNLFNRIDTVKAVKKQFVWFEWIREVNLVGFALTCLAVGVVFLYKISDYNRIKNKVSDVSANHEFTKKSISNLKQDVVTKKQSIRNTILPSVVNNHYETAIVNSENNSDVELYKTENGVFAGIVPLTTDKVETENMHLYSLPLVQSAQINMPLNPVYNTTELTKQQSIAYVIEASNTVMFRSNSNAISNSMGVVGMLGLTEEDYIGINYNVNNSNSQSNALVEKVSSQSYVDNKSIPDSTKETTIQYNIKQWFGIVYERRLWNIGYNLQPTIRATVGYAGSYPGGKISAAIVHKSTKNIDVRLGIEDYLLFIKQSNSTYNLNSIGAVLGVSYSF